MRTYSLFVGETISNNITVSLPPSLRNIVETECRAAWKELNTLDHPNETASPFMPYSDLMRTEEGRVHVNIMQTGFYIRNTISGYPVKPYAIPLELNEYNAMSSRIQAQRYSTQGRRKRVTSRASNSVEYRKFRSWWLSKHVAQALGAEFSEPCPFKPHTNSGSTESYIEMGNHFEEWTGYRLPKEIWVELKLEEAKRCEALAIKEANASQQLAA